MLPFHKTGLLCFREADSGTRPCLYLYMADEEEGLLLGIAKGRALACVRHDCVGRV